MCMGINPPPMVRAPHDGNARLSHARRSPSPGSHGSSNVSIRISRGGRHRRVRKGAHASVVDKYSDDEVLEYKGEDEASEDELLLK